jgi:general secretion pathway protein G
MTGFPVSLFCRRHCGRLRVHREFGIMVNKKQGFTLLELLVVMAIIALLAGLGSRGYSLSRRKARESRAKADIEKLRNALMEYRVEFGAYPVADSDTDFGRLGEIGYLTNAVEGVSLIDPWGRPYQYRRSAGSQHRFLYSIWSEGQNSETDDDNIDPSKAGY